MLRPRIAVLFFIVWNWVDKMVFWHYNKTMMSEEILENNSEIPEAVPLTKGQIEELEKRLISYYANPAAGTSWEDVKNRVT
jgi:hypothetical protein